LLQNHGVNAFETRADLVERERFAQREVQVFRKAIVGKVAALERRAPLEGKYRAEIRFREQVAVSNARNATVLMCASCPLA
jgi:hypothetical protein